MQNQSPFVPNANEEEAKLRDRNQNKAYGNICVEILNAEEQRNNLNFL